MGKLDVGASRVGLCDDGGVAVFLCGVAVFVRRSNRHHPSSPCLA